MTEHDTEAPTSMVVEIWSDVVCPWCYIGKRRFESALATFRAAHPEVDVDVRYRAFQLDPGAPVDHSEPVRAAYERKFGGPEMADAIIGKVSREAAGEGLEFRMDIAQRSNTLRAHHLLALAEEKGVQVELKERLMAAYFLEGEAIGNPEVLLDLAAEVGLDRDEARAWLESGDGRDEVDDHLTYAANNGIGGVPTYVFDRQVAIPGAQDPSVFVDMLERRLAAAGS